MKKSIYIFGVCCAIALGSCSESKTDEAAEGAETEEMTTEEAEPEVEITIVGDWKMSDFDMGMEVPKGQEAMFDKMRKDMIDNSKLSFKADGTYTQTDKMEVVRTQNGTYSVDGSTLKTTINGKSDEMNIASLTEDKLVLTMEERGSTMTMTYSR